jgi:succinate-semialdehyde dehydrogenase/glutarate-semialdehyde dehydrogenase
MVTEHATTIKCINPSTKQLIGEVPCFGPDEVEAAVCKSWNAFEAWRLTEYHHRAQKMLKLRSLISAQSDQIAQLVSSETGKPLTESYMAEIVGPLDACVWFAENTERALKEQIVNLDNPLLSSKQSIITFEPLGIVAMISPWNYPFAIPMMTIVMALMTGNSVILKPSEKASLTGIKIGELFTQAGFPDGLVTIVTGDRTTGSNLVSSKVQKVIFTGSVAGGSNVMATAARNLTPVSLELGGKDAAIVLPDAPVDWTANGLVWGAFTNCGQACASIERLYIVKGKRTDALINQIVALTRKLQVGPGLDPTADVGPLIDEIQLEKVASHVEEAQAGGAKILCGGMKRSDLSGYFYEPTVLTDVTADMKIMKEETFGPVLPITVVESEDAAIELANDCDYGLTASVWSHNLHRAEDVARDLDAGTVFINDCLFSFACPQVPWGGIKKSGSGRSHSYFGLLDLVNIKHISIDASGGPHRLWWYPYGKPRIETARAGIELIHGSFPFTKLRGVGRFLYNFMRKAKQ